MCKERLGFVPTDNKVERTNLPHRTNLAVIRKETYGYLVWSYKKDQYFLIKDKSIESLLQSLYTGNTKLSEITNEKLRSELSAIGISDNTEFKFINNKEKSSISPPLDVYFDYTWACNLRCPVCYNRDVARGVTMSDEKVRQVLKELSDNGVMRTHLAGGEPTLMPDRLKNYLDSAKEFGIRASVNTNGTNLTDEVAEILFNSNLVSLTFSVDGSTAAIHDEVRGEGAFDITTEAVKKAVKYKELKNSNTQIQIKAIWYPDTPLSELEALVKLGIELGADVVQFHNPERCLYHEKGYYGNVASDYYHKVEDINNLQKKYQGRVNIWNVCNPLGTEMTIGIPGNKGCIGAQELLAINPNGNITPCLMNPRSLGNLFEDHNGSLNNFLANSNELKNYQANAQVVDDDCQDCNHYESCRGGSKVRSIVEHGNMFGKDPLCPKDYISINDIDVVQNTVEKDDRRYNPEYEYLFAIAVAHSL